ncbi:MAG: DNA recombination protein RmuC, partial [Alphaproteobacteria bacterium]|nr:DNA recombination protein RmuC [Alphaproteobacteria bacterium]
GAFGEIQLENLVTEILPPSVYSFQHKLGNDKIADCLLRLPNPPGAMVIDSKFPLESYRRLREAKDEAAKLQAGRDFKTDVSKHVRAIAERYIVAGETAEWALMFLPSESVYAEVHDSFGVVVEDAFRQRVGIVSPTTMMATLHTIRAVLKDARMREQAGLIQVEVAKIAGDVGRLETRVQALQKHFGQATADVQHILTSTGKIVNRAERIGQAELGDVPEPDPAAALPGGDAP